MLKKSGTFLFFAVILGIAVDCFAASAQLLGNLQSASNKVIYNDSTKLVQENRLPCDACTQRNATLDKCEALTDDTQDATEKFGRTCNANCMRCYKGSCVFQSSTQDLFNHCPGNTNCADLVWGWNSNSCNRYNNSSTMNADNLCDGFGGCYARASDCNSETEGGTLASCGDAACKKACPTGAPIANYDSVDEICYTDNAQHGCSSGNVCNASGYCVSSFSGKRVFASSNSSYNGNMQGLNNMDNRCQNLANNSNQNLSTSTWKAWASAAGVNAKNRIADSSGGYYLVDKTTKIANNLADLSSNAADLLNTINMTENGVLVSPSNTWTGTYGNGTNHVNVCSDWTNNSGTPRGVQGNTGMVNDNWTQYNVSRRCNSTGRIYCFEQ
jgi:hypothetical protein